MEGGGRDALLDRPVHRPFEDVIVIVVHPEDEAAVDHDAEAVQPAGHGGVVASEILAFVAQREVARRERLEPDEQAAQPGFRGALDQIASEHGIDRRCALEQPPHSPHALEQRRRKPSVPEQMIVEEVEVPAGQSIDLGERIVYALRVERASALEEGVLVAEVAMLRTSARDDDRVRDEIGAATDQVAPDRRQPFQRPAGSRDVSGSRATGSEVLEELRKNLFARAEEDCVGVRGGLVREGGDVQAAEGNEDALRPVVIGQRIGAARAGDVDLNRDEVRRDLDVSTRSTCSSTMVASSSG